MKKLTALVLAVTVAATAVAAAPARTNQGELNIVQTAQQAGTFKTLLALATKAGLADELATGELTVSLRPTRRSSGFRSRRSAPCRRTRSC